MASADCENFASSWSTWKSRSCASSVPWTFPKHVAVAKGLAAHPNLADCLAGGVHPISPVIVHGLSIPSSLPPPNPVSTAIPGSTASLRLVRLPLGARVRAEAHPSLQNEVFDVQACATSLRIPYDADKDLAWNRGQAADKHRPATEVSNSASWGSAFEPRLRGQLQANYFDVSELRQLHAALDS